MVMVVLELVLEVCTIKFKVAALSHPTLLVRCFTWLPAALNVSPFQVYGRPEGQIVIVETELLAAFNVRFKVAALSQPPAVMIWAVCVPAPVNVNPFHV